MNDINEMPPKCQYCPYWEVCKYPWVCPDREQLATDTISRQAAIDALGEEPEVWIKEDDYARGLSNQWRYDVTALKAVQSAQPVITCDGCRFVGTYDTDFPCCSCVRREKDYYEPER